MFSDTKNNYWEFQNYFSDDTFDTKRCVALKENTKAFLQSKNVITYRYKQKNLNSIILKPINYLFCSLLRFGNNTAT